MSGRLRVLIATNLFPNNVDPGFAPFNRQQFAMLGRLADVDVFGVVPWRFGRYYGKGSVSDVVDREQIDALPVEHPRYPSIPGLPSLNAGLMAAALLPKLLKRRGRYDVILSAYAYPDGCAGVLLGRALSLPVVVKCHGSDLNRAPRDPAARLQLKALLPRAARVVVVSNKLGEVAIELGVARERLVTIYNGVNRDRFSPQDRREARARLDLPEGAEIVVAVGLLADHKGTRDLLDALPVLAAKRPGVIVAFVGDGPLFERVRDAAEHQGVDRCRVLAVGRVRHDEVPSWMAAGDVFCLPSWDEGMPNVVREAHAIGRPVVATDVGGLREAVFDPRLGRLVPPRDPYALADALAQQLAAERIDPAEVSRLAVVPSWEQSAAELYGVLEAAAGR